MWFEILPPAAIITTALTMCPIIALFAHKFTQNGNVYRRDITTDPNDLGLYQRDLFFGNPYVRKGLENIPDE